MDNVKLILAALVLVLGGAAMYFFVAATSASAQLATAQDTNKLTIELLRMQGAPCTAQSRDAAKLATCIEPLLAQKDFKEDNFKQPDEREQGFLVIKNVNRRAYEADKFIFSFDRQIVQKGCTIPGSIDFNIGCRFNFAQRCEKGSVLEVNYSTTNSTKKVFTKTC